MTLLHRKRWPKGKFELFLPTKALTRLNYQELTDLINRITQIRDAKPRPNHLYERLEILYRVALKHLDGVVTTKPLYDDNGLMVLTPNTRLDDSVLRTIPMHLLAALAPPKSTPYMALYRAVKVISKDYGLVALKPWAEIETLQAAMVAELSPPPATGDMSAEAPPAIVVPGKMRARWVPKALRPPAGDPDDAGGEDT